MMLQALSNVQEPLSTQDLEIVSFGRLRNEHIQKLKSKQLKLECFRAKKSERNKLTKLDLKAMK